MSHSQDPDDLWGDAPIARIEITTRRNGAMSTIWTFDNLPYALAMLDSARDAILAQYGRPTAGNGNGQIIVPQKDTGL